MKIIFNDVLQYSDAPETMKSPALADFSSFSTVTITLDSIRTFDAIGIGYTDASEVIINGDSVSVDSHDSNGLYMLPTSQTTSTVVIELVGGAKVGRIAIGKAFSLGASPAREPGFFSTATSRTTLSGQIVAGAGGISGRLISVDFRYKFTEEMYMEIQQAFPSQIARSFPFFITFVGCGGWEKYPIKRLYGFTKANWIFQSSANFFLYSKKFKFQEAF